MFLTQNQALNIQLQKVVMLHTEARLCQMERPNKLYPQLLKPLEVKLLLMKQLLIQVDIPLN
jgi:hypothetical protein